MLKRFCSVLLFFFSTQVSANDHSPPSMSFIPLGDEGTVAETSEQWTFTGSEWWLRNVDMPSVAVYPARNDKRNGAAVLVIPGGGFQFVSMSNEGWPIAEKLAAQGFTAVVLKYRTVPTPKQDAEFFQLMARLFSGQLNAEVGRLQRARAVLIAKADAQKALGWMKENSAKYGIDQSRMGVLGFSAGAMTAMAMVLDRETEQMPAFVAAIYGDMSAVTPPEEPMPLFVAIASDDPLLGHEDFGLIKQWHAAGGSTELHWYQGGGHGFGSFEKGTTSDRWFEQFTLWLTAEGFTKQ